MMRRTREVLQFEGLALISAAYNRAPCTLLCGALHGPIFPERLTAKRRTSRAHEPKRELQT